MIDEKRVNAAMDAFYPGEDWREGLGCALEGTLRDMRAAIAAADAAALLLTAPEGEGADMQEAVERACRAFVGPVWDAHGFTSRRYYRDAMREALAAALSTAPAARPGDEVAGFVLVPREPTDEMQVAGHKVRTRHIDRGGFYAGTDEIWSAMLAAAPAADGGRA